MTTAIHPSDRVLTIPNLLSALRLAGVGVFLWLALGPKADGAALAVLAFAGVSDYLDGKLARALSQTSRLGIVLDPLADRLYILATIIALTLRDIVPWWFAALLVGRDIMIMGVVPVLRRLGYGPTLPVHYLGKAATFNLLYAFPLLLLSAGDTWLATVARPLGWAFAGWGAALYWWSGILYWVQVRQLARAGNDSEPSAPPGTHPGEAGRADAEVGR
ncbi:CDP-alcohol phosphatidyltransferase family protein [Frankia sp. Cj5]|uniref:CDP-alcohol phosphatidyltransferase family protein n=1 Tax=Frankia sp. Cj5 TaxID=2880978 RepID=UPI001EF74720|nr:CDP-alcohol phosphatidyltransferase family protein [Frankia sp. Cj5]